jgi:hypothetical protein
MIKQELSYGISEFLPKKRSQLFLCIFKRRANVGAFFVFGRRVFFCQGVNSAKDSTFVQRKSQTKVCRFFLILKYKRERETGEIDDERVHLSSPHLAALWGQHL